MKKNIIYLLLFLVGFFGFNSNVNAESYTSWEFAFFSSKIPELYADMDYCVYNRVVANDEDSLYQHNVYTSDGKKYDTYSFVFLYDDINKLLLFATGLDENGDKIKFVSVSSEIYTWSEIKTYLFSTKQKFHFGSNLYSYLIENGKINCDKPLVFEESMGDLYIYRGNKYLMNDKFDPYRGYDNFKDADGNYDLNLICSGTILNSEDECAMIKKLYSYANPGYLRYGPKLTSSCEQKLNELTSLWNEYDEIVRPNYLYVREQNANFNSNNYSSELYQNIYDKYNIYSQKLTEIEKKLDELNVGVTKGDNFYLPKCDVINDAKGYYERLTGVITSVRDTSNSMMTHINSIVQIKGTEEDKEKAEDQKEDAQEAKDSWEKYLKAINTGEDLKDSSCKGILGPDLLDDISTLLTWIRIAVPILLIILGCVDFSKIIIIDDQQEMKRCVSRFVKRCIIAVAIFFLPTIIMYLLSFIDSVADVSCDIRLW